MRILQIVHSFLPESMTGSEIYVYNLAREMSKDNTVSVFYRINDARYREYEILKDTYDSLEVYKINNKLKAYRCPQDIYYNKDIEGKFAEVLEYIKPDVVHIHHLLFLSLGIIDEIKKRGIPIIFTLHDYWLICPRGQLLRYNLRLCNTPLEANCTFCLAAGLNLKNLLKRLLRFRGIWAFSNRFNLNLKDIYEKVDLFISPSRFLRNKFLEFGISEQKIIYLENGMDIDLFRDIEKSRTDKIRFGFVGTLIPSKGVHILIKAFNRIKSDKAILNIYGKSPVNNGIFDYSYRIKRMARYNKNIKFMGSFDNRDIAGIFKEIDVLVFPSLWQENSPLVLYEAILSKTPIIASNIGGVPEIVQHNKNGFLFAPGHTVQLSILINNIIENPGILHMLSYVAPVKDIKSNALELKGIYHKIKAGNAIN